MSHSRLAESSLAVLVVIDVQEKILSAISSSPPDEIVAAQSRLIGAARILDIPVIYTEQYPKGLGPTDPRLMKRLVETTGPLVKNTCSCWRDESFRNALQRTEREHVILCGLEAHVCVQQTAMDLLRVDYGVFVPADSVGSRQASDMEMAFNRMRRAGVEITTTESMIFELVERCDHPKFKDILEIIKQTASR